MELSGQENFFWNGATEDKEGEGIRPGMVFPLPCRKKSSMTEGKDAVIRQARGLCVYR